MNLATKIAITGVLLALANSSAFAQKVSASLAAGIGESYVIEQITFSNQVNHNQYFPTYSLKGQLNFSRPEAYFEFGASIMYSETKFYKSSFGFNYQSQMVSSSFYLNARHLNCNKKLNVGYGFALGITHEQNGYYSNSEAFNNGRFTFASFNTSGILSYNFTKRASLILESTLIWADINHTFKSDDWLFGREDLHFLTHLGIEYRFGK